MEKGYEFEKVEEMVLGIELSRYYHPSPGNEANYQTFRQHLAALSDEYPRFKLLEKKTGELLLRKHVVGASAETLVEYCLEQQKKEELPLRHFYENTTFQLVRSDELSTELEKRLYESALSTETCAGWFGLGRKLEELFSVDEIEKALQEVSDEEIRRYLLINLVDRGKNQKALKLFNRSSPFEKTALFRSLARLRPSVDRTVSTDEARFWSEMFELDPLEVLNQGWRRIEQEPAQFSFLLEPMKSYFLAHVFERSGEFLLDEDPALPATLLMIILALEKDLDLEIWLPAAQYGGYHMIDIDYEHGYKFGDRKGKNFSVSAFAVGQLEHRKIELPDSVPVSIPVPYRDPHDR